MDVTAMPEVVDGAGVLISSQEPEAVAEGVREALELGPEAHAARAASGSSTSSPWRSGATASCGVVREALRLAQIS